MGLLQQAGIAISRDFNYPLALGYLESAAQLSPRSASVVQFYASVLLSQGHLERALERFQQVFHSSSAFKSDRFFLQQYVLALHRLGREAELGRVWPTIVSTPGVQWRSPFQCPDAVDESLLDGATPFPSLRGLRVPSVLQQHAGDILREFEAFRGRDDWMAPQYFRPNQDNDLVLGNQPSHWTELLLFSRGKWDPKHCALLPTACKVLRGFLEIEGISHGKRSGQVSLLKLDAGATLVPHFGSVNWRYTAHLGLLVPEGVTLHGGGESRPYRRGEVLLLDDSFLHSVEHRGDGPRVTLFANFFHPRATVISYDEWRRQRDEA